jgi:hypothetical protein
MFEINQKELVNKGDLTRIVYLVGLRGKKVRTPCYAREPWWGIKKLYHILCMSVIILNILKL